MTSFPTGRGALDVDHYAVVPLARRRLVTKCFLSTADLKERSVTSFPTGRRALDVDHYAVVPLARRCLATGGFSSAGLSLEKRPVTSFPTGRGAFDVGRSRLAGGRRQGFSFRKQQKTALSGRFCFRVVLFLSRFQGTEARKVGVSGSWWGFRVVGLFSGCGIFSRAVAADDRFLAGFLRI